MLPEPQRAKLRTVSHAAMFLPRQPGQREIAVYNLGVAIASLKIGSTAGLQVHNAIRKVLAAPDGEPFRWATTELSELISSLLYPND